MPLNSFCISTALKSYCYSNIHTQTETVHVLGYLVIVNQVYNISINFFLCFLLSIVDKALHQANTLAEYPFRLTTSMEAR